MSSLEKHDGPPKPRLTLRVGVSGKRKLAPAERARIGAEIANVLDGLSHILAECWDANQAVLAPERPTLRVILGLAEGADQLVAQVAIDRAASEHPGSECETRLAAILPFAQDEFEKDFASDPLRPPDDDRRSQEEYQQVVERFRTLLAQAKREAVLEIDDETILASGDLKQRNRGYAALRDLLIQHSDVVIAISDDIDGGSGGTVDVMRGAVQEGIPVIKISTTARPIRLMRAAEPDDPDQAPKEGDEFTPGGPPPKALVDLLKPSLWPPQPPTPQDHKEHRHSHAPVRPGLTRLNNFLGESFAPVSFSWIFKACRNGLVEWSKCTWPGCLRKGWAEFRKMRAGYHIDTPSEKFDGLWLKGGAIAAPYATEERFRRILVWRHVWPDTLAVRYADATRSSYIAIASCGAFAILVGLLAVLFWSYLEAPAKIILLALEGLILWHAGRRFFRPAHHGSWHERMVEYRVLAELLRHQRFLYAFGWAERAERIGDRSWREPDAWLGWYMRATARELGFPTVRLSADYRRAALAAFQHEELEDQINYNDTDRARMRLIDDTLGSSIVRAWRAAVGTAAVGTILVAVLYAYELMHWPFYHEVDWSLRHVIKPVLTVIMAFLPALIAAVHGVRFQMEFGNAAKRAETTFHELTVVNDRWVKPTLDAKEPPGRRKCCALVRLANEAMVADLAGWSTVYQNKAAELS